MNKMMMVIALSAAGMQAMEIDKAKSWNIALYDTKINLTQVFPNKMNVDVMVVGYNKQLGSYRILQNQEIGLQKDAYEILAAVPGDDHGLHLFNLSNVSSNVLSIVEPWLSEYFLYVNHTYNKTGYMYCRAKKEKGEVTGEDYIVRSEFYGEKAIEEASKDLKSCYEIVLKEVLKDLGNKEKKSIALPALSADLNLITHKVDFPRKEAAPIAVASILEFIKNNFRAYDRMELFVETDDEFALYKKLLENSVVEK